jgi:hypothetical protein
MTKILTYKSDIDLDYPICRPSLDLDFTQEVLDNRITFTRGSTGTRVNRNRLIETVAANQPRFDYDPISGECKGLLIEESRQNLLLQSNSPDNLVSPWGKGANTTRIGVTAAPDGTNTAVYFSGNGSSANEFVNQSVNLSANTTYTCSVWVKLIAGTGSVPTTGTIISASYHNGTALTRSTVSYNNNLTTEWKRFSTTFTNVTAQTGVSMFFIADQNNTAQIAIWGAQLEEGSFPTSYIPTSASTVTRSADTANISGTNFSNFFNSTEGTLFVDSEMPYQTVNKFPAIGFSNGGGASNCIQFYYYNTSSPWVAWLVRNFADAAGGGTVAANLIEAPGFTNTPGVYKKLAGTYKFGEFNYYFDGKIVSRTTPNKRLPTVNLLEIGKNGSTVNRLNGHIRRITYYPIAITNTQMVNLTS